MRSFLPLLLSATFAAAADPPCPAEYSVEFQTDISADPIVVRVVRSLAPLGADRFHALVTDGFYNQSAFFRVAPGFVLQVRAVSSSPSAPLPHWGCGGRDLLPKLALLPKRARPSTPPGLAPI